MLGKSVMAAVLMMPAFMEKNEGNQLYFGFDILFFFLLLFSTFIRNFASDLTKK